MANGLGRPQRLLLGLIGAQAANAVFDIVALYPVGESSKVGNWAKRWAKEDLDRLMFPERFRFVFPIVKVSSVAGLLFGLRWKALGRLTASAVVAYFVAALAFHVRAKDPARQYVPAVAMLLWSSLALRAFSRSSVPTTANPAVAAHRSRSSAVSASISGARSQPAR